MVKRSELVEELARLNRIIEEKESALVEQTVKNSSLTKDFGQLKELFEETFKTQGKKDVGINTRKPDFEFELSDLKKFLNSPWECDSESFIAMNREWHLSFDVEEKDFLAIYLCLDDSLRGQKVKTTFYLSILGQANEDQLLRKTTEVFKGGQECWGWATFISSEELEDDGFIEDDKIKVSVYIESAESVSTE